MSGEYGYGMLGPTAVQLWYSAFSGGQAWMPGSLKELQKPEGRCLVVWWLLMPTEGPGPLCRDEAERTWSNTVGHTGACSVPQGRQLTTAVQLLPGQFRR